MKAFTITNLKRFLTLVLAICMIMSVMNFSVFATGEGETGEGVVLGSSSINASSVFVYEEGSLVQKTISDEVGYTSGGNGYRLSKTISKANTNNPNEYVITLTVDTEETVVTKQTKMATVLVIDVSASMSNSAGTMTRMQASIAAAKAFLNSYAHDKNGVLKENQELAIVEFGSYSRTLLDWTDVGKSETNYNNALAVINGLSPYGSYSGKGATNLYGGLLDATTLLNKDPVKNDEYNRSVVLLTDGAPTKYYKNANKTSENGSSIDGDGSNPDSTAIDKARTQAVTVKNKASLYTVCLGAGDNKCYTQDKCVNCGKTKSEHNHYGNSYYCSGKNGKKYSETVINCSSFLKNEIATTQIDSDKPFAYNTSDAAQLATAFTAIANDITTSGQNGAGTQVVDPAPEYITIQTNTVTGDKDFFAAKEKSLVWDLSSTDTTHCNKTSSGSGDSITNTYHYFLSYNIVVDPASEYATEGINPTNGRTYLNIPGTSGNTQIDFNVPAINVVRPTAVWAIHYFKQDIGENGQPAETYTEVTADALSGNAKIFTSLDLEAKDENYETKYAAANYTFNVAKTTATQIKIGTDASKNVINVYYDVAATTYTVTKNYKLITIANNGDSSTQTDSDSQTYPGYIGCPAEVTAAETEMHFGGYSLQLKDATPTVVDGKSTIPALKANASENNIVLNYEKIIDNRVPATVIIKHEYRSHLWTRTGNEADGYKWTYAETTTGEITLPEARQPSGEYWALQTYNVTSEDTVPMDGYNNFVADEDNPTSKVLNEGQNEILLAYDLYNDVPAGATVKVIHNYKYTVNAYVNGVLTPSVSTGTYMVAGPTGLHAGDTYVADPCYTDTTDNGTNHTYTSYKGINKIVELKAGENIINLYYEDVKNPNKTNVTVNHYFYDLVENEGTIKPIHVEDKDDQESLGECYVGAPYTASPKTGTGYTAIGTEEFYGLASSPLTGFAAENNGSVVNIYYYKDTTANAYVLHKYQTKTAYFDVDKNEVAYRTSEDGSKKAQERSGLAAGTSFTAEYEPIYNGVSYETIVSTVPSQTITLNAGTNVITITYEKEASELKPTTYKATYIYGTLKQEVVNGEAVWNFYPDTDKTTYDQPEEGETVYVGQTVTLEARADRAYPEKLEGPDNLDKQLAESGNEWTFKYAKIEPLAEVQYTEYHYFKTVKYVNGVKTDETEYEPLFKNGETVKTLAGMPGAVSSKAGTDYTFDKVDVTPETEYVKDDKNNISFTVDQNMVIKYYYHADNDEEKLADVSVQHIYETYFYDETLKSRRVDNPIVTENCKVLKTFKAGAAIEEGYEIISVTYNDETLAEPYEITVAEGRNEIVFVYKRTLAPEEVSYTVNHLYYEDAAALEKGDTTEKNTVGYKGIDGQNTREADLAETAPSGKLYDFVKAEPARSIKVTRDGNNVINLYYVRATSAYTVIHDYYCNGVQEGTPTADAPVPAKVGEAINALDDSVVAKKTMDGKYALNTDKSTQSITVDTDPTENVIYLRYDRYTYQVSVNHNYTTYIDGVATATDNRSWSETVDQGARYETGAVLTDNDGNEYNCIRMPESCIAEDIKQNISFNFAYRRDLYTVTVNHHYKTIIDHEAQPEVLISEKVKDGDNTKFFLSGESWTATPVTDPNGEGAEKAFTCKTDAEEMTKTVADAAVVFDIYYEREFHNAITIEVEHQYVTYVNGVEDEEEYFTSTLAPAPVVNKNETYVAEIDTLEGEFSCISTEAERTVEKVAGGEKIIVKYVRNLYDYSITYFDGYSDNEGVDDAENGRFKETEKTFGVDKNGAIGQGERFSRTGYRFVGWTTEKGSNNVEFEEGSSVALPIVLNDEEDTSEEEENTLKTQAAEEKIYHLDLYGVWVDDGGIPYIPETPPTKEELKPEVIYHETEDRKDDEGGENYDPEKGITADDPVDALEEKEFEGWTNAPGGEVVYKPGDKIVVTGGETVDLWPVWKDAEPKVIEEPETPLSDFDETIVPLADVPEVYEDLLDDDVPLANVPATGDSGIWEFGVIVSGILLCVLNIFKKKKKTDEA